MKLAKEIVLWQIVGVVIGLLTYGGGGRWAVHFGVTMLITNMIAGSIHALVATFQRSPWGTGTPRIVRVPVIAVLVGVGTLAGVGFSLGILNGLLGMRVLGWSRTWPLVRFSIIAAAAATLLIMVVRSLSEEIERRRFENQRLKHLQVETELKALRARLDPHFLFNALNTLLALVRKRPEEAEQVILKMAALYRRVLDLPERDTTTLNEELTLVRAYLDIEKARLGERLNYDITCEPDALDCALPPLILQPLVENAVRHGIDPLPEGGSIKLTAVRQDGLLRVAVADSGAGFSAEEKGTGIGLGSVIERMRLRHGTRGSVRIESPPEGGTRIELEIPYADYDADRRG